MVTNYGLRLRISQQNQSIEQWASITAYTSIYPLISHLSCPSAQSVSILHKGLNAAFAFGARLIYISAGRNPVNLFFNTCVSIDRSIDRSIFAPKDNPAFRTYRNGARQQHGIQCQPWLIDSSYVLKSQSFPTGWAPPVM